MAKTVMIKHPAYGMVKKGYVGFSWTYLFFGWLVPLVRGELGIAALHLLFCICTLCGWQIVMALLYNKQYMTRMLVERGYVLSDTEPVNEMVRLKLGMAGGA